MATGRDILILYNYFLFAHDMAARWVKGETHSCQPLSGGAVPEEAIISGLYDRAWIASLYAVVEGWNGLRLRTPTKWEGPNGGEYLSFCQARVNATLAEKTGELTRRKANGPEVEETYEDLLRRARNKVFHFEPSYLPDELRRFYMEAEERRWPRRLHENFVMFFTAWFMANAPARSADG